MLSLKKLLLNLGEASISPTGNSFQGGHDHIISLSLIHRFPSYFAETSIFPLASWTE